MQPKFYFPYKIVPGRHFRYPNPARENRISLHREMYKFGWERPAACSTSRIDVVLVTRDTAKKAAVQRRSRRRWPRKFISLRTINTLMNLHDEDGGTRRRSKSWEIMGVVLLLYSCPVSGSIYSGLFFKISSSSRIRKENNGWKLINP